MSTNREKGNTPNDAVLACVVGAATKIQIDVRAARCGGHEARGEMGNVAMRQTSGESDAVQMLANEIAIVMITKVPVGRCAAVEGIEGRRLVNGRVAEVGTRLAASEGGKDDGKFAVIQIEVAIDPKPADEGIRMAAEARTFAANAAGKTKAEMELFRDVEIAVSNDVALPNEAGAIHLETAGVLPETGEGMFNPAHVEVTIAIKVVDEETEDAGASDRITEETS